MPSYLPLPAGATRGAVWAAGSDGYLAGQAPDGKLLLWHHGELVDVNSPVSTSISVSGVNGSGEIVGYDGRSSSAFVYRDGTFQTLSGPPGTSVSAQAINDSGDIVGTAYVFPGPYRSVVWKRDQPGTYLIVADDVAIGIDNAGNVAREIDVARVQMLLFTLIAAVFVVTKVLVSYVIPEIPEGFQILMGISNGVYMGSKVVQKS